MNLFLSYSIDDTPLVERVRRDLEDQGHQVWRDAVKIELGSSIVAEVEYGLRNADAMVLFWSAAAERSPWVQRERAAWLMLQLDEERQARNDGRAPRRFL